MKVKAEDCSIREKRLQGDASKARMKMKSDGFKMDDQAKVIARLKQKLKLTEQKLAAEKAVVKAKSREIMLCTRKVKGLSSSVASKKSRSKTIETKMSAGEGALMGEIERNKKTIRQEKDHGIVLGNSLRK